MSSRVQRYRVTAEFVLQDRGDYIAFCQALRAAMNEVACSVPSQSDYLAVEKVNGGTIDEFGRQNDQ